MFYYASIALHNSVVVTYNFYAQHPVGTLYFVLSWIMWTMIVLSTFAIWYGVIQGLMYREWSRYTYGKLYDNSTEKLAKICANYNKK